MPAATERRLRQAERDAGELTRRQEARRNPPPLPSAVDLARLAGLEPDDWQAELLTSDADQSIILAGRQVGKTSVAGVLAAHDAVSLPGALCLFVSRSLRQAAEAYRGAAHAYRALGTAAPRVVAESALRVEFENGSRIIALPASSETIRGYPKVTRLILDEAAFIGDALYHVVRPMLAVSRGKLLAMSTPFGKLGWYYEAWERGEHWQRYEVPSASCTRISAAFLEEERRAMPERVYQREYECQFVEADEAMLIEADILRALDNDVAPLWAGERLFA